ncbi:MAG: hypothetical protein KAU49_04915 [Candidatus Krumholzibacteria bacterium]|nr:hypothetical protein [Candidatus Krumholzibacteria bacterium]
MKNAAVILFILTAAAIAEGPAAAQEVDSSTVVLPDSTAKSGEGLSSLLASQPAPPEGMDEKADSTKPPWVAPVWSIEYRANESEYRLGTGMGLTFEPGDGWRASSDVKITKRQYRGRDMSDINERFSNSAIKLVPDLYNVNLALGQDYLRQKAVGLARSGGDMVIENKYLNAGVAWERPELWASKSRFSLMGRLGAGQNDFKYDNNLQGNASGYLWYGIGPDLDVSGGYGIWRKMEDSDVSGRKFENMHSDIDTISAKVGYGTGDVKLLFVDYKRTMGVVRKVDPPRGNSLEVIENPDLAKMERSSRKTERVFIKSSIRPGDFLKVDFEFLRDYFDQQNVVDTRLSKETELKKISAKAVYYYSPGGRLDISIERKENDIDYGPVSLSSYLEKARVLKASLSHDLTDSLRLTMRGSGSLKQRYYRKKDANPRDADYLYYSFFADLDARLPLDILAGVKFTYKQRETINIDRSLSGDNRTDFTYWVVPRFTLRPSGWFEIGQEYEIKMEFTDFTFKDNENYLDRTTIMNTKAKFKFFRSHLGITHRYQFIDTGSYLPPPEGGERLYGRTNESFEHRFDFRYDYQPVTDFTLFTHANYRFQENNRLGEVNGQVGVVDTRYYDSGQMTLGFNRLAKLTEYGKVDLNVAWVRRFGPNLTRERREFWEIDMNVKINF